MRTEYISKCKKEFKFIQNEYFSDITDIFGFEPYFEKYVKIGTLDKTNKTVKPAHGYYPPHIYGKSMKKAAKKLHLNFIEN